jgi:threonine aldolase
MSVIDFRTDFIARPTTAMIAAMNRAARLQPDLGHREDPTVARLEAKAAALLGKQDALFCPTCTQANQIAIYLACRPGESVIADNMSHIYNSEAGGSAALSGALAVRVNGRNGTLDPDEVRAAIRVGDSSRSRTALIVMENTHVYSGGRVVPLAAMRAIRKLAQQRRLPVHIDGARLFNAAVALGQPARALAACADSVAVSLNKGLGAPMGAVLAGSREMIAEAVRVRQMLGGGWRPANIMAAAATVALETMIDRLADDHRNARRLAEGLAGCRGIAVDLAQVETNIVLARIDEGVIATGELIARLARRGILVMPITVGAGNVLRFVTHHDIRRRDIDRTVGAIAAITRARSGSSRRRAR